MNLDQESLLNKKKEKKIVIDLDYLFAKISQRYLNMGLRWNGMELRWRDMGLR